MNIAQKHNITVPVRIADCPLVLTIVTVEERTYRNQDGSSATADTLLGHDERHTLRAVRLNDITVEQLVRHLGPETDEWTDKRILVSVYQKSDKGYISFAPAPTELLPAPQRLPGPAAADHQPATPRKNRQAPKLAPETQAAIKHLEETLKS